MNLRYRDKKLPIFSNSFFLINKLWCCLRLSLVAPMVKNLPAMQETQVQSLGREDCSGEGNGNPLQYSCLGNHKDRGTWWAKIHGVSESQR